MKLIAVVLCACLLLGCSTGTDAIDSATTFRQKVLTANGCQFDALITADYEDSIYKFKMQCTSDSTGALQFTVTSPEAIAGIIGSVSDDGGKLTFDDKLLLFPMIADGQASPVSAPWIFLKAIRGGYISGCGQEQEGLRISVDDSYEENALHLEILTDENCIPQFAEIIWNQKRILSIEIQNFVLL